MASNQLSVHQSAETDAAAIRAADLLSRYGHLDGVDLLRAILVDELPGRIALVSSFGAESAVFR